MIRRWLAQVREHDAGSLQFVAGCEAFPRDHIRKRPRDVMVTRRFGGVPTWAKCDGCGLELRLTYGRIPPHDPGPPRFTKCPTCGGRHRPSYNDPVCAWCAGSLGGNADE